MLLWCGRIPQYVYITATDVDVFWNTCCLLLLFLLLYLLSFRILHCDHHRQHIQPASSPHILSLHPRTVNWCLVRFRLVILTENKQKIQSHELKCIDRRKWRRIDHLTIEHNKTGNVGRAYSFLLAQYQCFGYVFVLFFLSFLQLPLNPNQKKKRKQIKRRNVQI